MTNPDWDGVMKAKARIIESIPGAMLGRFIAHGESASEHLRNALALLGGLRSLLTSDAQRELLEAVSQRVWRAVQQIEGKA